MKSITLTNHQNVVHACKLDKVGMDADALDIALVQSESRRSVLSFLQRLVLSQAGVRFYMRKSRLLPRTDSATGGAGLLAVYWTELKL